MLNKCGSVISPGQGTRRCSHFTAFKAYNRWSIFRPALSHAHAVKLIYQISALLSEVVRLVLICQMSPIVSLKEMSPD